MAKQVDMTKGVIYKQILLFFFPILIGTFFQQLYNTVDTIIVGQYLGTHALAAVGSTANLSNFIINMFVGLSSGTSVVIAHYYGAKEYDKVKDAVHTGLLLAIICGFFMMIFGLFYSKQCLSWVGVPTEILDDASTYMRIFFLCMIPGCIYNIGAGILRAIGDSKTPLYYLIICSFINVVFDYIFIVLIPLGIAGAAYATSLSQLICGILVVIKLMKSKGCHQLYIRQLKIKTSILKKIIKIGIPAAIQSNMYAIANIIIQSYINAFGTSIIASWSVFGKIDSLYWMISGAFGVSITTFVGQNYGAGLYKRVKKGVLSATFMNMIIAFLFSFIMILFGENICYIFSKDTHLIKECGSMIRFMSPFYFTFVCVEIFTGTMRACGESFKPMLVTGVGICLLRVLWVTCISIHYNSFDMIMISYPITWITTSLLFIIYYYLFSKKYLKENL